MPYCDVCQGNKRVRLATIRELTPIESGDALPDVSDIGWKEFDCPQCCMVPYRRVRATKVSTEYPVEQFGKFQMPIERSLAARFGEYLYREGLIKFTTDGSKDFGMMRDKITVTAHLGVITREDTLKAGAVPEVAITTPPPVGPKLTRQQQERLARISPRAVPWRPKADDETRVEFADPFEEPKDAIANRFSGLEI